MDHNRHGLHIVYLGIEYHPIFVNIISANIVIARSINDQRSCCVIIDDGMVNNGGMVGDAKVVLYVDQVLMVVG